jgi:hypothetical protein
VVYFLRISRNLVMKNWRAPLVKTVVVTPVARLLLQRHLK